MNARYVSFGIFGRESLPTLVIPLALGALLAWQNNIQHRPDSGVFFTAFLGFFWCLILTVLAARDRCSELELALPFSGIQIWKNHIFSTLVQTSAHVAIFLLPTILACSPYLIQKYLVIGGYVLSGLIFTGALIHRIEPGCNRVRDTGQLNGAVGAGLIVTVLLLVFRSPWLPLITIVAAGLLLLASARKVRDSLTLVDDRSEPRGGYMSLGRWEAAGGESGSSPVILEGPSRAGRYLSTLWMVGMMNVRRYSMPALVFCFLILLFLGGELVSPSAWMGTVVISVLATLIVLNVLSSEMNRGTSPYAHLPLPRRRLHAGLLLPVVAVIAFGAVIQISIFLAFHDTYPGLVSVYSHDVDGVRKYRINVPPRFHQIAWDGEPPAVVSSTGETYVPALSVHRVSHDVQDGPAVYNPFEVGSGSSTAFAVEQYTRAVKTVYGIDLDPQQAELLMSRDGGRLDTVEGLTVAGGPQLTAIGMMIFCAVYTLITAVNALISRLVPPARLAQWRSKPQALVVPGLGIIFIATVIAMKTSARFYLWLAYAGSVLATHLAPLLPGAFLSLTAALACLVAVYLLSQELFARREVSPGKVEV